MAFKVKIKNIGKLADAEIHIGDFTVFAGPRLSAISRSLSTAAIFPRIGSVIGQASSMRYFLLHALDRNNRFVRNFRDIYHYF